jgi:MFS family permease
VYQSYLYYLPIYFQNVRNYTVVASAALSAPVVVFQMIGSILSGQYISRRKRYGEVLWLGFGLWTLGSGLTCIFSRTTHPAVIAVILSVVGFGVGNVFQPTLVALQAHATKAQRAVVISNRNFFRCAGGACGLAISAAILQAVLRTSLPPKYAWLASSTYSIPKNLGADETAVVDAYMAASRAVFILQSPLISLCLVGCLLVRDRGLERPSGKVEMGEKSAGGDEESGSVLEKTDPSIAERDEKEVIIPPLQEEENRMSETEENINSASGVDDETTKQMGHKN